MSHRNLGNAKDIVSMIYDFFYVLQTFNKFLQSILNVPLALSVDFASQGPGFFLSLALSYSACSSPDCVKYEIRLVKNNHAQR
jgi:hypothetical protein